MKTLTPEQLNIGICEWLGWKMNDYPHPLALDMWYHADAPQCADGRYCGMEELPSHTSGREALGNMHEAEKRLLNDGKLGELFGRYQVELRKVTDQPYHNDCHATALQRCTALLRVVRPELFEKDPIQ